MPLSTGRSWTFAISVLALGGVYFGAAKLGLSLGIAPQVSVVWPPTGLALAAVLLLGYRMWPGIWLGAFVANVTAHEPIATAVGIAVGNTLEAVGSAWLLHRMVAFRPSLDRLRDVLDFVMAAAFAGTTLSATIGVVSLILGGVHPWQRFGQLWWSWWLGDAAGALVVAPLLLTWARVRRVPWRRAQLGEAAALLLGLVGVSTMIFSDTVLGDKYAVFPFMIWAALRFGQVGTTTVAFLASAIAIWGTVMNPQPSANVQESLMLLQLFMGVVAVSGLLLAAAISERRRTQEEQRFLTDASQVLVSSLDYEETLTKVARLAVPTLADWCTVDVLQPDGSIRRLASAGADPTEEAPAREVEPRYPAETEEPSGLAAVIRSGSALLVPELSATSNRDVDRVPPARGRGRQSAMLVPLLVRGRVLGTIGFGSTESGRRYERSDLALAEEVARRAAQAIENAQAYRDAEAARAEAEAANRAKDEFLATLSHELRTPLNAILGWAQVLRIGQNDLTQVQLGLSTIERNARRQAQLIDDLLDLSRIAAGKLRLELLPVDLTAVITAAVETVRPAADVKTIGIGLDLEPGPGAVMGDSDRLQQVFANLLANAVKFTPNGGRVEVRLERAGSRVRVTVSDTGQGIGPELLPVIFERFRQADSSMTRAHGGLGLGLAIVRHLVELHGGSVEAASSGPGQGAAFTVTLPRMPVRAAAPGPPVLNAPVAVRCDGIHVLVVDDEPDGRQVLAAFLGANGAAVTAVGSAREALAALDRERPHVIVTDLAMPEQDGFAFLRAVRSRPAERGGRIPLVALTAHAGWATRGRALQSGFETYLTKPVEPVELAAVVARVAGRMSAPPPAARSSSG